MLLQMAEGGLLKIRSSIQATRTLAKKVKIHFLGGLWKFTNGLPRPEEHSFKDQELTVGERSQLAACFVPTLFAPALWEL